MDPRMPSGFDRARNTEIGFKNIELTHLEEAFTSEHWIVRIFKVKKLVNRLRVEGSGSGKRRRPSRKTAHDRRGLVGSRSRIVKGVRPAVATGSNSTVSAL